MKRFVYAVTPNPALDLGGQVDNMTPNEKSYVYKQTKHPGGNSINAARILSRLDTPVICTGFLGGSTGQEIKELLDDEGVRNRFISIHQSTRVNVTISNKKDHNQTRLTFPGPQIQRSEKLKLFNFIKNQKNMSHLLIGGSLPPGFSSGDAIHLANNAKDKGIDTIIDCPGKLLRKMIEARPLLIKPNLIEFQELTKTKVTSLNSVTREARKLLKKIPMLCISSVEGGTLLMTQNSSHFGRIAPVKIRSTVGAGDSMVGAIVAQLYQKNEDPLDLLRWGLAASAATLTKTGTSLGDAADIKKLYKKTIVIQL